MQTISSTMMLLALVLLCGVALNRFSKFLKMPILICFLGVGIICGKHGMNIFPELQIADVQHWGEIALCFIIFSGGLQTSFKSVKSVFVTGTILSTLGVVLTALLFAAFTFLISNNMSIFYSPTFLMCVLGASAMASTDAAAVFAILRGRKAAINPKLQSLLEYESGSNDPAAFLLVSIMIGILNSGNSAGIFGISWRIALGIVWGLGMGAVIGFLVGVAGQWFYNWIQSFLEHNGLRFVVAVAIVLFCYGVTDAVFHANVLMASYVAGITMGNLRFNFKQIFIRLHDGVSWLMQILLFTALGCFFDFRMFFNLRNMLGATFSALFLMFIARPFVVMLCMIGSPFTIKERIFTGWVGIRGSAPIMLAALVVSSISLTQGIPKENMFYMVFTVVLLSILVQGSSIMWVAKKLDLIQPYQKEQESLLNYDERADGRELYDFVISEENPLVGQKLLECGVNNTSAILLMVKRGNQILQQTPEVVLQSGDILSFLGKREAMTRLHQMFFADENYSFSPTFHQLWRDFVLQNRKKLQRLSPKNNRGKVQRG